MMIVGRAFVGLLTCISTLIIALNVVPCHANAEGTVTPCPSKNISTLQAAADRPKVGLALGGGGTRGAAHVGVLKVLHDEGIPIDYIAGTSMGAIVGGLYCAGVPPETIEEKLLDMSLMRSFICVPVFFEVLATPVKLSPRLVGHKSYFGLYKGCKFLKYLNKSIPACKSEISALPIPFRAVALNLLDGRVYGIDSGNLGLAMLASSAMPSLRMPVSMDGKLFVDGGAMKNLPVDVAKKMGADIVIAVDVDENVKDVPPDTFKILGAVPRRLLTLQLNASDTAAAKDADILIHPNVDGIRLISRRKEDGARAIKAGQDAARAALPAIKAALTAAHTTAQAQAQQELSDESPVSAVSAATETQP